MDAIFQSTFLCSLLMFWLCIYHGLRQNEKKFLTFYLPKLIIIFPMWLCAIVLATWEKYNELRDPTYNHFVDTGNYNVWHFWRLGFGTDAILWAFSPFFWFSRISKRFSTSPVGCIYCTWPCWYWRHTVNFVQCHFSVTIHHHRLQLSTQLTTILIWFSFISADMRLKFLTLLMIFVVAITILLAMNRFGFGILEDNFVASLNTTYKNSAQFMCFYGLLNFYLFTMAYVYSPSGKPAHGKWPFSPFHRFVYWSDALIVIVRLHLLADRQRRASPKIIQHFPWSTTRTKMLSMGPTTTADVH